MLNSPPIETVVQYFGKMTLQSNEERTKVCRYSLLQCNKKEGTVMQSSVDKNTHGECRMTSAARD